MKIISWSRSEKYKKIEIRSETHFKNLREREREREKTKQNGWKGELKLWLGHNHRSEQLSSPHRFAQALRWEDNRERETERQKETMKKKEGSACYRE